MMILMMAAFKEEWRLTRWHAHGPYQSVQVTSFSCSSACIQIPLTAMLSGPYQAVSMSHWCIDDALVFISVLLYIYDDEYDEYDGPSTTTVMIKLTYWW
jgi:hypothetical protein